MDHYQFNLSGVTRVLVVPLGLDSSAICISFRWDSRGEPLHIHYIYFLCICFLWGSFGSGRNVFLFSCENNFWSRWVSLTLCALHLIHTLPCPILLHFAAISHLFPLSHQHLRSLNSCYDWWIYGCRLKVRYQTYSLPCFDYSLSTYIPYHKCYLYYIKDVNQIFPFRA